MPNASSAAVNLEELHYSTRPEVTSRGVCHSNAKPKTRDSKTLPAIAFFRRCLQNYLALELYKDARHVASNDSTVLEISVHCSVPDRACRFW